MKILKSKYPRTPNNKKRNCSKLCLMGLLLVLADISPSYAVTLDDVIESAIASHPSLKKEELNVEKANLGLDIARSAYRPKLNFRVTHGEAFRRSTLTNFPTIEDTISPQSAGLFLEHKIYDGGKRAVDKKISEIELKKSSKRQEQTKNDITAELINAFFDYAQAEKIFTLAEENEKFAEQQYNLSKKRFEVGVIAETEVFISEANYLELKSDLLKARSDRLQMREVLNLLAGTNFTTKPIVQPIPLPLKTHDEIKTCIVENSASLDLAQYDFQIAEQRSKRAKYAWRPTVDLNVSATSKSDKPLLTNLYHFLIFKLKS